MSLYIVRTSSSLSCPSSVGCMRYRELSASISQMSVNPYLLGRCQSRSRHNARNNCKQWFWVARLWSRLHPELRPQSGLKTAIGTEPGAQRRTVTWTGPKTNGCWPGWTLATVAFCDWYNFGSKNIVGFLSYHDLVYMYRFSFAGSLTHRFPICTLIDIRCVAMKKHHKSRPHCGFSTATQQILLTFRIGDL